MKPWIPPGWLLAAKEGKSPEGNFLIRSNERGCHFEKMAGPGTLRLL
jgi:hypothetical protein